MTTSRVGAVIDALVAGLQASPAFAAAKVYDGPVTSGDTYWTSAVFVGFDGNWQSDRLGQVAAHAEYEGARINQKLVYLGNTSVQEEIEVPCIAESWSGDPAIQTARNNCLAMLAGVEKVLRADPTLGIDGSTIAELQVGSLSYFFDDGGNLCARVPFTVHVLTTLLSPP